MPPASWTHLFDMIWKPKVQWPCDQKYGHHCQTKLLVDSNRRLCSPQRNCWRLCFFVTKIRIECPSGMAYNKCYMLRVIGDIMGWYKKIQQNTKRSIKRFGQSNIEMLVPSKVNLHLSESSWPTFELIRQVALETCKRRKFTNYQITTNYWWGTESYYYSTCS